MNNLQRIDFEADFGEIIQKYAERAVLYLARRQLKHPDLELYLVADFNGVKVVTNKFSTVDSIVLDYNIRQEINGYEYQQTDEYKKRKAAREKEEKELNTKAKYMMKSFDKIDKHNRTELINWLDEFQPLSDHMTVTFGKYHLIKELNEAGYYAGMNCNTDGFVISITDEFADWIIGQCIDGLEHIGAIHQVVHKFADEYRKKVNVSND